MYYSQMAISTYLKFNFITVLLVMRDTSKAIVIVLMNIL